MTISELNAGQGNVNVEGTITEVGESRTFSKFGKEMTVTNAILQDDSGTVKLTLWNEDASKYKEGDKVKITNGYVNEFQGEKQLTSGKFGQIEKVDGSEQSSESDIGKGDSEKDESFLEKAGEKIKEVIEDLTEDKEESEKETEAEETSEESPSKDLDVDETAVEDADGTPDELPVASEDVSSEEGEETEDQEETTI